MAAALEQSKERHDLGSRGRRGGGRRDRLNAYLPDLAAALSRQADELGYLDRITEARATAAEAETDQYGHAPLNPVIGRSRAGGHRSMEHRGKVVGFAENAGYADAQYAEELRAGSQALVRLDTMYGGGDVLPLALRSFRTAAGLLATGGCAPAAELDLQAAIGEAAEVAAWVAYDTNQNDLSRQLIHEALLASRLAGDREMELFELSHLAMLDTHIYRPREALRISVHALESGPLPDRVASVFEIRRGRALAQLADGPGGLAAMQRARALAEGDGPEWTWWVDEPELVLHEGQALGEAGDWAAAVPYMERAADQVLATRTRDSYVFHAFLLNAQARAGTWNDAGPILARLAGLAGMVSSARTVALLRDVTRHLTVKAPPDIAEAARELASALRK